MTIATGRGCHSFLGEFRHLCTCRFVVFRVEMAKNLGNTFCQHTQQRAKRHFDEKDTIRQMPILTRTFFLEKVTNETRQF